MNQENHLFTEGDLRATIENIRKKLAEEVTTLTESQVNGSDGEQTIEHLVSSYTILPLKIHEEGLEAVELGETEVQVRNDWGQNFKAKRLQFRLELPFEGSGELLLRLRPSSHDLNPPRGKITAGKVTRILHAGPSDAEAIKREIESWKRSIINYAGYQKGEVEQWNKGLPALIQQLVEHRRSKLAADLQLLGNIGIPIRKRSDPPKAYVLPAKQTVVTSHLPNPKPNAITKPEPMLEMATYEDILDTLASMSVTMERCPSAFEAMGEEDLRMQFLIPLNSKYKGETSGETFNASGKTDILIKKDDRIVFVAECKFWKGPQSLTKTIDQLLGYLTWRETKAAILLFNRQKDLTAILAKVPEVFRLHPSFVREENYPSETGFRFIVRNPTDPQRHLIITLLAFDVPTTE